MRYRKATKDDINELIELRKKQLVDEVKNSGCEVIKLQASVYGKPVYKKFGFKESEGHMIMRI